MIKKLGNIPVSLWIAFVLAAIPSVPLALVSLANYMFRSVVFFLMPLALVAIALLAAGQEPGRAERRIALWVIALVFLAYSAMLFGSMGQYLFPAAVVMFFAAARAK